MSKIEKQILKTLAFFFVFKRPLTIEEIWRYLYQEKASKLQVFMGLKKLEKNEIIIRKNHYYFLAEKNIFKEFLKNREVCMRRWQKINFVVKFLKIIPFVKNVSVINSLSFGASNENSDIDILVITQKNRLWIARALVVVVLEILGQNKNKWYQANKFCLGFAFDEERLNLSSLRLSPPAGKDIYLSYWLANLTPVFDRAIYKELIEQNAWLKKDLPNWKLKNITSSNKKKSFLEKAFSGHLGDILESKLATIQIKKVYADPKTWHRGGSVIVDEHMLKLHPYDKRTFFYKKWQERVSRLGI